MKNNIKYYIVATLLLVGFIACNDTAKTKAPKLKNQIDSLNYAFGLANGADFKMYVIQGEDSIDQKVSMFVRGLMDGMGGEFTDNMEIRSTGTQFGTWLNEQTKEEVGFLGDSLLKVNYMLVRQGLVNSIKGDTTQMTSEFANEYLTKVMQTRMEAKLEKQYKAKKEENLKFLEENKQKKGVITTESGLQYEVIKKGKGILPVDTSLVKVHYVGTLIDGTEFDNSKKRGKEPTEFNVNRVIKGWTEGLQLMPEGSKYKFYIPYDIAYGAQGTNTIPPFSTLVFEVELIKVEK